MPQTLPSAAQMASPDPAIIPLQDILALHRALVSARARLPDLDAFLLDVLETLCHHLRAEGGLIGLCDSGRRTFAQIVRSGAAPAVPSNGLLSTPLPCHFQAEAAERNAMAVAWAEEAARGSELAVLGAAGLAVRDDAMGIVCLFGAAGCERFAWQQEGLAAAALEIGLAVSHLRLRRDVESRLRERNERWSALYEIALALTRVMDSDQLLDELVRRAIRLLRTRGGSLSVTDEVTGESVVTVAYINGKPAEPMLGYRMPPGEGLAAHVMATGHTLHLPDYEFEQHSALSKLRTSVIAAPLFVQDQAVGVLAVGDDPAVRQFTEDDVQTVELLAQAAGAILEKAHGRSQERSLTIHRERARLARELHDGLAQNLASLLLRAEVCHDIARHSAPDLAPPIDALAEGIQQAVRETRAAIASLHEAPSDGERLMDALSLLAARFESQTRVPVALSWEGQAHRSFPAATHMALLRVAQEALANVRKHACARNVCAHLNASDPKIVELTVHDDGCGFDAQQMDATDDRQRFGLRGMRGRMEELGGSLTIDTARGCGTTVTAVVPLSGPGRQ